MKLDRSLRRLVDDGVAEIDALRTHRDRPGGPFRVDVDVDAFLDCPGADERFPPAGRARVGHLAVWHAEQQRNLKPKLSRFVRAKGPG